MSIYLLKEPEYENSTWCRDVLAGLLRETKARRISVVFLPSPGHLRPGVFTKKDALAIIGSSHLWLSEAVAAGRRAADNRIIVLSNQSQKLLSSNCSLVSSDIASSMNVISFYLKHCKKDRIALYGANCNSTADAFRIDCFQSIYGNGGDIFKNDGSLQKCFDAFYPVIMNYDAILCANDYAAISLLQGLKARDYPNWDKLFLISYADTLLAKYFSPTITSISMNFLEFGKAAIMIYKSMQKECFFSSIAISINWTLHVRETTGEPQPAYGTENAYLPVRGIPNDNFYDNFYDDPQIIEMLRMETLLNACDAVDMAILKHILQGATYDKMAESLHMSINGIKYKIKNMTSLCNVRSRHEFVPLIQKYIRCNL